MAVVTQKTEKPGTYEQSFTAVKGQMMKNNRIRKEYSEEEIDAMVKQSLMEKALDKIEFSLRGELRRGRPKKMRMSPEEFEKLWRLRMKKKLINDGFPFTMTKGEKDLLAVVRERIAKKSAEEVSKIASEAMKKILQNV